MGSDIFARAALRCCMPALWLPVLLVPSGRASAQDRQTVEVQRCQDLGEDLSISEARQRALVDLRAEAVRQVTGVRLQSETRMTKELTGSELEQRMLSIVDASSEGRVVSDTILQKGVRVDSLPGQRQHVCYAVRLRAVVARETGKLDPAFQLDIALANGRDVFYDRDGGNQKSDEIVLNVKTSADAFVTIFDVAQDTAQVVLPNESAPNNFVRAGEALTFPPAGMHLRAQLPPGRRRSSETLIVVATRRMIPFEQGPAHARAEGTVPTVSVTIGGLYAWLTRIPLDERAVKTVTYEIRAPAAR